MRQQELFSVMTGIGMPYDIKLIFPHSINANALRPAREALLSRRAPEGRRSEATGTTAE